MDHDQFFLWMLRKGACEPAVKWVRQGQHDAYRAWHECRNAAWMLWALECLGTSRVRWVDVADVILTELCVQLGQAPLGDCDARPQLQAWLKRPDLIADLETVDTTALRIRDELDVIQLQIVFHPSPQNDARYHMLCAHRAALRVAKCLGHPDPVGQAAMYALTAAHKDPSVLADIVRARISWEDVRGSFA